MSPNVLIPCKSLVAGKSRLASVLDPAARAALCARMLEQTLERVLALVSAERCYVVSADEAALAFAAARRVAAIGDPGAGLNAALAGAREAILGAGAGAGLLVLPIDLPYASIAALRSLLQVKADVVAAPDRRRRGTNALFLAPDAALRFEFCFGDDSFALHRRAAQRAKLRFAAFNDPGIAFDVDRPEDLSEWRLTARAGGGGDVDGGRLGPSIRLP